MPPKKVAINGQKCAEGIRLPGPRITSLLCVYKLTLTLVGGADMHMENSDRNKMVTRPAGARDILSCVGMQLVV